MPRNDLLALTTDDLATLSNPGNVKRAVREIESGQPDVELQENEEGDVIARWSDGVECRLPAGAVPADAQCTCPAATFCRHLVRTVLAYQRRAKQPETPAVSQDPWDPGAITDAALNAGYRKQALVKARSQFQEGLLVELVRSAKPTAHFDDEGCTVRFLVPGELGYTRCDCDEPAPCRHVAMAVWAFRQLGTDCDAGLVSTHTQRLPVPLSVLDDVESSVQRLAADGLSSISAVGRDQFRRLEARCRDAGLVWMADILVDLVLEYERYGAHDARFAPMHLAELIGELLVRSDAVRSDTGEVPQLVIRGNRQDRLTTMGHARLVGLGCGVRGSRRSAELNAYLQDVGTGSVVVVGRDFPDPAPEAAVEPKSFRQLAQTHVVQGASLAALGVGQLLIRGGKRAANRRFLPGRARATVHPQGFEWERLRAPVLAEDFQEIRARLAAAPPASLRPRRLTEDFHVCRIAGVESVQFDPVQQAVVATLHDTAGGTALLWHPYSTRGKEGSESLLAALHSRAEQVVFAAGRVCLRFSDLVLLPTCLVLDEAGTRTAIQPWIEAFAAGTNGSAHMELVAPSDEPADPVGDYPGQLLEGLGELLLCGLRDIDASWIRQWREMARLGRAAGLTRLAGLTDALADQMEAKLGTPRWDPLSATDALTRLSALAKLAADLA